MKKFTRFITVCITVYLIMAFSAKYLSFQESVPVDTRPAIEVIMPELKVPEIKIERKDHSSFLNKIGHYESSNDYSKVNRWGYMGKYQFHSKTLKALDIEVPKKKFLNSPVLQEVAMEKLLTANHKNLKRFIRKYEGKVLHGVLVTESGVLAAAHLGGAGNVRKWFRTGEDFKDGNGTPITKYMKVFGGYSLDIE